MTKPRKPGTFLPGKSGNPSGRPKLPEDINKARTLNRIEFERVLNRYLYMSKAEIMKAAQDPGTPALELMIASMISKGTNEGDHLRIEFLISRVIGKVPERIQIEDEFKNLTRDNLILILKQEMGLIGSDAKQESEEGPIDY